MENVYLQKYTYVCVFIHAYMMCVHIYQYSTFWNVELVFALSFTTTATSNKT